MLTVVGHNNPVEPLVYSDLNVLPGASGTTHQTFSITASTLTCTAKSPFTTTGPSQFFLKNLTSSHVRYVPFTTSFPHAAASSTRSRVSLSPCAYSSLIFAASYGNCGGTTNAGPVRQHRTGVHGTYLAAAAFLP